MICTYIVWVYTVSLLSWHKFKTKLKIFFVFRTVKICIVCTYAAALPHKVQLHMYVGPIHKLLILSAVG